MARKPARKGVRVPSSRDPPRKDPRAHVASLLAFLGGKFRCGAEFMEATPPGGASTLSFNLGSAIPQNCDGECHVAEDTELFRDVFSASPIGIAVETLEGRPLFVNPALCSMLGFSEEEMSTKHCVQFSPPEDADKDWALFQQLRAGSIDHYQLEKRYFRRDGSLLWGKLSISLLKGRPAPLVVAMVEDITERKKAEEAHFRHAAIIESSEDAIASATLDGVITSWNPGAERIFGYTESEAIGKSITILVPPDLPSEEDQILEKLRAGGRIDQFETVRIAKTGARIDVSLSISPIKDATGKIIGCSGIARDITERKRAEEALRSSEERLRLAQQAARIGTFEWNIRTGTNTWTSELESMHGLPPGGFGGTQSMWKSFVHPEDRARVNDLVNQSLTTGVPAQAEWRVVWPDGSVHWVAGRWRVLMNEAGEPLRMVGVNIDVTDRKRTEEALSEVNRKLIEAQEDERNRIGRELHDDINQRLAMLAVELERLQQEPSAVEDRVQGLRRELADISSDVQALSHDLHSSKLEYLGVVAGLKSWCQEFAERQNASIHFKSDVESDLPFDVGRTLLRILQEAVRNTIEHSGVKHVEVQLLQKFSEIQLIVSDSGRGFDVEDAMKGKGLGLTSMRERARLMNGTTTIESKPMSGTTICVRVPLGSQYFPLSEAV